MDDVVLAEKWPVLGRHELAAGWLRIWADLGRAPRTIDAYARGLAEYLNVCERENVDPAGARRWSAPGRAPTAARISGRGRAGCGGSASVKK